MNIYHLLKDGAREVSRGYGQILLNGFDRGNGEPIKLSHFIPHNQWKAHKEWADYIIDQSNGDEYWIDDPLMKKMKCLALAGATPLVQIGSLLLNMINRIIKLVTLAHFWYPSQNSNDSFKRRLSRFGEDALNAALTPIYYLGLELSALYGLVRPYDGAKLYATFERCAFGKAFLAPCFQPQPTEHFFGGDPVSGVW